MPIQRAQMVVQGRHKNERGTFIRDGVGPISPIFDGLQGLYQWMREGGWYMDEHGTTPNGDAGVFYPWRVAKAGQP